MKKMVCILILVLISSSFCQKSTKDSALEGAGEKALQKSIDAGEYQMPVNPIGTEEITKIVMNLRNINPDSVKPGDIAVIETKFGVIKFKFFPDIAPKHCAVFKTLANSGFYNGVLFHRLIPGFVIQGGDILSRDANPNNDGTGNPGLRVPAEFSGKSHKRGIISAARRGNDINSASTQFFICHGDAISLDGQYSVFGEVIEGMDVVDKIVHVPAQNDRPIEEVMMLRVRVIKE